ncbi:hypothetical protein FF2_040235 [Malus domestica]
MMEKRQLVLQEFVTQLPSETPIKYMDPHEDAGFQILTDSLDQTLGRRSGTYCKGMGNARREEPRASSSSQSKGKVTALTAEVAGLRTELTLYKSQISLIIQTLSQSSIRHPDIRPPSKSKPLQPKHARTPPLRPLSPSSTLSPSCLNLSSHMRTTTP